MMRGSEWYVMRDGRIAEVRAYFAYSDKSDTDSPAFHMVHAATLRESLNGAALPLARADLPIR